MFSKFHKSFHKGSSHLRVARVALPNFFPESYTQDRSIQLTELLNYEHLCFISIYFVPVSKMCLKIPEKPKWAHKGIILSVKLDTSVFGVIL